MNSTEKQFFSSNSTEIPNRAFLNGDAVKVSFFVRGNQLIMAEECYFFLMASMRKMRMKIPLSYTLEFFQQLFSEHILAAGVTDGIINFLVYRNAEDGILSRADVSFYFDLSEKNDILEAGKALEMDVLKEISVNTNLLSNIRVHCPENVYAEIYAAENDLDDVILLNPKKRIARSIYGNLLFLENNTLKTPKQTEGAYISPLLENLITFIHRNNLAEIDQVEMNPFESQKADEIIMVSDEKGIFPVRKIRNKEFPCKKFYEILQLWRSEFKN